MSKSGWLARQQAAIDARLMESRRHTRTYTLDLVTIALGRMGFRESRFKRFDEELTKAAKDYADLITSDVREDKDMVYSKATLDRELQQYTGSMFVPYERRYT